MTRGELAKTTGANGETIRFYEKIGLIRHPPRSSGGHRIYDEGDVRRLTFILRSRALGFGIEEIHGLLALMDSGSVTCEEVRATALRHLDDIRQKIADLKKMEEVLAETAAKCKGGSAPNCPIIDALSAA